MNEPRLYEAAAELRHVREWLKALETALDWYGLEHPDAVAEIREKARRNLPRPPQC